MMTPRTFMAGAIKAHEGGLSLRPEDNGNWFDPVRYKKGLPQKRGLGKLVGSKYGVTAYALAAFTRDDNIEAWEMKAMTFDTAVDIAEHIYVKAPRLNLLPQNRVTLSLIDMGWGTGPVQAIKLWQRMIGANDDGKIGTESINKTKAFFEKHGEEQAARLWGAVRDKFYTQIATNEGPNDPDRIFLKGWKNRTASFLPGTTWWKLSA